MGINGYCTVYGFLFSFSLEHLWSQDRVLGRQAQFVELRRLNRLRHGAVGMRYVFRLIHLFLGQFC